MGFDVVYLPPIHPIGKRNRKGANNSVMAMPWDVGSPWAIGSDEGGHDAVHPDLGTMADFDAFVRRASRARHGGRARLRIAGGCRIIRGSPSTPDGSPPSPTGRSRTPRTRRRSTRTSIRSTSTTIPRGSTPRCLRVLQVWIDAGVTIFRVDNPHTKPINFWQWLIATVEDEASGRAVPGRGVHPSRR